MRSPKQPRTCDRCPQRIRSGNKNGRCYRCMRRMYCPVCLGANDGESKWCTSCLSVRADLLAALREVRVDGEGFRMPRVCRIGG